MEEALGEEETSPRPDAGSLAAQACATAKRSLNAANLCAAGLAFLAAFGLASITALLRLEFDAPGRSVAAERRLSEDTCAGVDYRLTSASLGFELLFALLARHLVDLIGRRPTVRGPGWIQKRIASTPRLRRG